MQPPSADFGMELWSAEVIRVLDFSRYCVTPPLHYSMVEDVLSIARMTSIWELANPQLRDITVYEAGKPIEETARELGIDPGAIIKLASNENPLGPSPKAIQAMRAALENAHLYPDGSGFYLCKAIAAKLGLAPENI